MDGIGFEWHTAKKATNLLKHGVTFREASTVFGDHFSITIPDPDHGTNEERFVTIGMSDSIFSSKNEPGGLVRRAGAPF